MKYLPFENYYLKTKLSPDIIKQRLDMYIEPEKFRFGYFEKGNQKPYEGSISDSSFIVNRILDFSNPFQPIIYGEIENDKLENRIHIKMSMRPLVMAFMFIWLAGVGIGALTIALQHSNRENFNGEIIVTLFMFFAG